MNTEKILNPPAKRLRGPAGLDEVVVDGCAFTETVAQKMPRPPLFCGLSAIHGFIRPGCALLKVDGGKVLLSLDDVTKTVNGTPARIGRFYPFPPAGPAYTGPITPAMWAIIRRHWNP